MKQIYMFIMAFSQLAVAQSVYELPFGSKGNVIELAVEENETKSENLMVQIKNKPGWINFNDSVVEISSMQNASFEFDVAEYAPVGKREKINISVSDYNGNVWEKSISVQVNLPENYSLKQNYPNPFNPSTTISYLLAEKSQVTLKIYNILGQEIEKLVDEEQTAGLQKIKWNAGRYASGIYFCILDAKAPMRNRFIDRKKMVFVK